MAETQKYQNRSDVRTGAAPRVNPKRTHQIGVRVTDEELRRLQVRATIAPYGPRPVATYLRMRGLDSEPRCDPAPGLVDALARVADELLECRQATPMNAKATQRAVEKATTTFRKLIALVG